MGAGSPRGPPPRSRGRAYGGREISSDDASLRLYVEDGGKAVLQKILRVLDREGIEPHSISLSEPTLDDVFLRQTGRSLRDGGAGENGEAAA